MSVLAVHVKMAAPVVTLSTDLSVPALQGTVGFTARQVCKYCPGYGEVYYNDLS